MAVEPKEYSTALDRALAGNMHAPMEIFISAVIKNGGRQGTAYEWQPTRDECHCDKRDLADRNERRAVPPGHRHSVPIGFPLEMISLVGPKNAVMGEGVPFEREIGRAHV